MGVRAPLPLLAARQMPCSLFAYENFVKIVEVRQILSWFWRRFKRIGRKWKHEPRQLKAKCIEIDFKNPGIGRIWIRCVSKFEPTRN